MSLWPFRIGDRVRTTKWHNLRTPAWIATGSRFLNQWGQVGVVEEHRVEMLSPDPEGLTSSWYLVLHPNGGEGWYEAQELRDPEPSSLKLSATTTLWTLLDQADRVAVDPMDCASPLPPPAEPEPGPAMPPLHETVGTPVVRPHSLLGPSGDASWFDTFQNRFWSRQLSMDFLELRVGMPGVGPHSPSMPLGWTPECGLSPYRVFCLAHNGAGCGHQHLTEDQFSQQAARFTWTCPRCGANASLDASWFDSYVTALSAEGVSDPVDPLQSITITIDLEREQVAALRLRDGESGHYLVGTMTACTVLRALEPGVNPPYPLRSFQNQDGTPVTCPECTERVSHWTEYQGVRV